MHGGFSVPGYTLVRRLDDSGGQAAVHLGRSVAPPHHEAAIKIYHSALRSTQDRRRFQREVDAMERLAGDPHVIDVYSADVLPNGQAYLVMKLCMGGSLAALLNERGPMSPAAVASIGETMAETLDRAHRMGVLHRDLKPHNILLDENGSPVLADFGIVAVQAADMSMTATARWTAAYAAPELFRNHPASVRTDVYGLAATLYTLLAGYAPHHERGRTPSPAELLQRRSGPPDDLDGVPPKLMSVVQRGLAPAPEERYATAGAFAAALRDCAPAPAPFVAQSLADPIATPDPLTAPIEALYRADSVRRAPFADLVEPARRAAQLGDTARAGDAARLADPARVGDVARMGDGPRGEDAGRLGDLGWMVDPARLEGGRGEAGRDSAAVDSRGGAAGAKMGRHAAREETPDFVPRKDPTPTQLSNVDRQHQVALRPGVQPGLLATWLLGTITLSVLGAGLAHPVWLMCWFAATLLIGLATAAGGRVLGGISFAASMTLGLIVAVKSYDDSQVGSLAWVLAATLVAIMAGAWGHTSAAVRLRWFAWRQRVSHRRWWGQASVRPELTSVEAVPAARFFRLAEGTCHYAVVSGGGVALVRWASWPAGRYIVTDAEVRKDGQTWAQGTGELERARRGLSIVDESAVDTRCRVFLAVDSPGELRRKELKGDLTVCHTRDLADALGGFLAEDPYEVDLELLASLLPLAEKG